jgi:rhamnosyltransferase
VEVRVIENRGRDVSALLVGAADLVNKYDLICYVHDKKSSYMLPETVGETWGDELFECNLSSAEYVQNIINEFRQKPHLGLSIAPPPHHAGYFFLLNGNHNWAENYSPTVSLLKTLGAQNAPISRSLPLFAPFGSMFWFRTKAMTKIFNKTWKYTDFDAEPLGLDATISHAIERVWAYLAADLGYYSMIAIPDNYFAAEFGALAHYLHGITPILVKNRVSFGPPKVMSSSLKDLLGGH